MPVIQTYSFACAPCCSPVPETCYDCPEGGITRLPDEWVLTVSGVDPYQPPDATNLWYSHLNGSWTLIKTTVTGGSMYPFDGTFWYYKDSSLITPPPAGLASWYSGCSRTPVDLDDKGYVIVCRCEDDYDIYGIGTGLRVYVYYFDAELRSGSAAPKMEFMEFSISLLNSSAFGKIPMDGQCDPCYFISSSSSIVTNHYTCAGGSLYRTQSPTIEISAP